MVMISLTDEGKGNSCVSNLDCF